MPSPPVYEIVKVTPPSSTAAPCGRPANVPTTASVKSLSMMTIGTVGGSPVTLRMALPRVTVPLTVSWSCWLPFTSTANVVVGFMVTLPLPNRSP